MAVFSDNNTIQPTDKKDKTAERQLSCIEQDYTKQKLITIFGTSLDVG